MCSQSIYSEPIMVGLLVSFIFKIGWIVSWMTNEFGLVLCGGRNLFCSLSDQLCDPTSFFARALAAVLPGAMLSAHLHLMLKIKIDKLCIHKKAKAHTGL